MATIDTITNQFRCFLEGEYGHVNVEDNAFHIPVYADYQDTLERGTVNEDILRADSPRDALYDLIDNAYDNYMFQQQVSIMEKFESQFKAENPDYSWGPEDTDMLKQIASEMLVFDLPLDHFLKMRYPVNIYLDVRDSNYDFTLAMHYPHWAKGEDEAFDDESCVVWLAKQQGYTKEQLEAAMNGDGTPNPKGFLQTLRTEELNCHSCMLTIGFMVMMDLDSILDLNERLRLHEKYGREKRQVVDDSVVIIGQNTTCGLLDPWDGGGGTLDLELEKDVVLPISVIYSALPDGGEGLSNLNWFGICESVYKPLKKLDIKEMEVK